MRRKGGGERVGRENGLRKERSFLTFVRSSLEASGRVSSVEATEGDGRQQDATSSKWRLHNLIQSK